MSFGETWRAFGLLIADPSSHVAAACAGWAYPITRADAVQRDLYDLTLQVAWANGGRKGKKPKRYPRPWPDQVKKTLKAGADLTQDEIIAALRAAGHTAAVPTL